MPPELLYSLHGILHQNYTEHTQDFSNTFQVQEWSNCWYIEGNWRQSIWIVFLLCLLFYFNTFTHVCYFIVFILNFTLLLLISLLQNNVHETEKKQVFWNRNTEFHRTSMHVYWTMEKQLTNTLFTVWVPSCVWTTSVKICWIQ